MTTVKNPISARWVWAGIALLAWFLYAVRHILSPFLMAAVLAYLLNPLVSFLEVRGLRRERAVMILFVVLVSLATGVSYWGLSALAGDIPDLRDAWPDYMRRAGEAVRHVQSILELEWPHLKDSRFLERTLSTAMGWVQERLFQTPALMAAAVHFVVDLLLAPFIAYFFLRGGGRLAQLGLDACPGYWMERFLSLLNRFGWVAGQYTRGILLEALLVGLCSVAGLHLLGMEYAGLIGLIAGVGNMIPYFGPVLGGAVGVVAALFQFSNFTVPIQVVVMFTVVHYIDSYIFQPLIMKQSVNLTPVTVVFALLCGIQLAGVWGLILAVPAAGLFKETGAVFYSWYRAERGLIIPSRELTHAASRPWVV